MRMVSRLPYCSLVSVRISENFLEHSSIGSGGTALSLDTPFAAQGRSLNKTTWYALELPFTANETPAEQASDTFKFCHGEERTF